MWEICESLAKEITNLDLNRESVSNPQMFSVKLFQNLVAKMHKKQNKKKQKTLYLL